MIESLTLTITLITNPGETYDENSFPIELKQDEIARQVQVLPPKSKSLVFLGPRRQQIQRV